MSPALVRHLLFLPLALPVSAAFAPDRLVSEASALGARLGTALAGLDVAHPHSPPSLPPPTDVEELPLALAAPPATERHGKRGKHPATASRAKDAGFAGGIYVGKETVLRLANAGVVPAARPVAPAEGRPGGLVLSGVSALGVGVSDGDVLVEVEGRPVVTEAQVVGLVLGARSRRAPQVSAVILRAGGRERWSLVVAMPYID